VAGRIPESFFETLNDRLNLVDVVSSRIPLKKAGREYAGRCPFHDDSSPSFSVNPDKQSITALGAAHLEDSSALSWNMTGLTL
jgi:DNA primase (bacterial type)